MNICVYGASSKSIDEKYVKAIEFLGETIGKRNHNLVFGGGASGSMGASARGALKGGAKKILGIAPRFFDVDGVLFDKCTDFIFTDTMRERKKLLEDNSDAFIITPGGIGTFDEFFEILTLKQLGVHNKPIAIYNIDGYYNPLIYLMENARDGKFLSQATIGLYKISSDINELFDYIENYDEKLLDLTEYKSVNSNINVKK